MVRVKHLSRTPVFDLASLPFRQSVGSHMATHNPSNRAVFLVAVRVDQPAQEGALP